MTNKTDEHVHYMVNEIVTKLRMATGAAMKPDDFSVEQYEDIKDIYDMVTSKDRFSIMEMEAIVSELGQLRKKQE